MDLETEIFFLENPKPQASRLGEVCGQFLEEHPRGRLIGMTFLGWVPILNDVFGQTSLSELSFPARLDGECLFVACRDAQTVSELMLSKTQLMEAYQKRFDKLIFSDFYFFYADENEVYTRSTPQTSVSPDKRDPPPQNTRAVSDNPLLENTKQSLREHPGRRRENYPNSPQRARSRRYVSRTDLSKLYPEVGMASAFLDLGTVHPDRFSR